MKRRFRLKHTSDFKRVRGSGRAYTHPLFVLLVMHGEVKTSRLGITVHRGFGSAVARNQVKRRIRSIAGPWMENTENTWDAVVIVRNQAKQAEYNELYTALASLFFRARLISNAERNDS